MTAYKLVRWRRLARATVIGGVILGLFAAFILAVAYAVEHFLPVIGALALLVIAAITGTVALEVYEEI